MKDNLYEDIKKSGLKLEYVAKVLNINRRTLYGKLKGQKGYKLKQEEIEIIKELLSRFANV